MRQLIAGILLLFSALHAAEIDSGGTALHFLDSDHPAESDAATQYLQSQFLDEKEVTELKALAKKYQKLAARAESTLDWQIYGLKATAAQKAKEALQKYKNLAPDSAPRERLRAISKIRSAADSENLDTQRLYFHEAEFPRPEKADHKRFMSYFFHVYHDYQNPATPREQEKFWQLLRQLPTLDRNYLLQKHEEIPLIARQLIEGEGPQDIDLYRIWCTDLGASHSYGKGDDRLLLGREKEIRAVLSRLLRESPQYVSKLAKGEDRGELFAAIKRLRQLGIPRQKQAFLLRRFVIQQNVHPTPMSIRLSRVILMWNDAALVPALLESGLDANESATLRALTYDLFISEKLDPWITKYRRRLTANNSALNRRVLAHLLRAKGQWQAAFSVLNADDAQYPLYYTLALECGHWEKALRILIRLRPITEETSTLATLVFHLKCAFLTQHAGLKKEFCQHLDKALAIKKEVKKEKYSSPEDFHRAKIQGLLVIRRPGLAFQAAREFNLSAEAFQILTLQHKYPEALAFALDCARGPSSQTQKTARQARAYFQKRAPKKAAALEKALAGEPADNTGKAKETPPDAEKSPVFRSPTAILESMAKAEEVADQELAHFLELAKKPENQEMREKLLTIWNARDANYFNLNQMTPLLEMADEWQRLAQGYLRKWQLSRYFGGRLYRSGHYLVKAGRESEGQRRMDAALRVPLGFEPFDLYYLLSHIAPEKPAKQKVERSFRLVHHLDREVNPTSRYYLDSLRAPHAKLRRENRELVAGRLWAADHINTFIYRKLFWALNNGMHLQEDFGINALKNGRLGEAESRLAEAWRLSIEPTTLGADLVEYYQLIGRKEEARHIYETFRDRLQSYAREMPGDPRFPKKIAEWQKATGFQN